MTLEKAWKISSSKVTFRNVHLSHLNISHDSVKVGSTIWKFASPDGQVVPDIPTDLVFCSKTEDVGSHLWYVLGGDLKVQLAIYVDFPEYFLSANFHFMFRWPLSLFAGQVVDGETDVEPSKGHTNNGPTTKIFYAWQT